MQKPCQPTLPTGQKVLRKNCPAKIADEAALFFPEGDKHMDVEALKEWFIDNRRSFPWREDPSPYRVWVSEVMLQQTRASVVEPYFLRWMELFPTLSALAEAPIEKVIKAWEGLGYYSRARNLHAGALFVMQHYNGIIPSSYKELIKIRGLGPYTVGAILSFAFHKKVAALDGNGIRVLSRYFAIQKDVQATETITQLWDLAQKILPEEEPWLVVEGLIELGATLCTIEPRCHLCPVKQGCLALQRDLQTELPFKAKKIAITPLFRSVFILYYQEKVLAQKKQTGLMADLYEFPYLEGEHSNLPFGAKGIQLKRLDPITHHFTRFKATLQPTIWQLTEPLDLAGHEWLDVAKLDVYPFSSGHRKIRMQLGS